MKYVYYEQNDDNSYSLYFTDEFYALIRPHYHGGSYFDFLPRLFGLLPKDYHHYVGAHYNAFFKPSPNLQNHIYTRWKNLADLQRFGAEIDRRIDYCVQRGDFN